MSDYFCGLCDKEITAQILGGAPYLTFKNKLVCFDCYLDIIRPIYQMAGMGDGGLIHIVFVDCLQSPHNKARRNSLSANKKLLKKLLYKYNFQCVECGCKKDLTIDHIKPVKHSGTDDFSNLQILCRSCNSKKGATWNDQEREPNSLSTEKSSLQTSGSPHPGN